MENISKNIMDIAEDIKDEIIGLRREIHENPELGVEISNTTRVVEKYLAKQGIENISKDGQSVIGIIKGTKGDSDKTILLRADMDALPINEENGKPYASKTENRMHACGHDAHTAWLMGAANILSRLKGEFSGNVKFAFQPCEESEQGIGAGEMIDDGVMENPKVDIAVGAHVSPDIKSGCFAIAGGAVTASIGVFHIDITGRGGHASEPEKCVDPITIMHEIYSNISSMQRRLIEPSNPTVISVTEVNSGVVINAIPETARMSGTIRNFSNEDMDALMGEIEKVSNTVAEMYGGKAEFSYEIELFPTINDDEVSELVKKSARNLLDDESRIVKPPHTLGGDDFADFARAVPSCYFYSGINNEAKGIDVPLHNCNFDIDEDVLHLTSALLSQVVVDYLN